MAKPEAPARLPRLLQGIAGLALALMLAACQPADNGDARMPPNKGVASSLHLNALMDAAFGSRQQVVDTQQVRWRANLMLPPQQAARLPSSMLPASEPLAPLASMPEAGGAAPALLQRTAVVALPREVVRLNETQAVLVFESVQADEEGRPQREPTSKAALGTVFYTRVAESAGNSKPRTPGEEQWQVTSFQPYVDAIGYDGSAGDSQVYKLAPERYLLTFESESCWKGTCGSWLNGYLLQPDGLALALQSRLAGNNRTAYPDCDARLAPQRSGPRQPRRRVVIPAQAGVASAAASAAVQGHSCFDVRGEVHPISREAASADVSIRFKGLVSNARGDRQPVQETQLFRLNDGLYEQVDGGPNPVPEF